MSRPFGPYLLKFALPLLLILITALLTLLLPADRLDVRSAMGITALLACFAFHYTQSDTLPDVTYVVAADQLFLGSYLFVAGTLILSVLAYRLHEKRPNLARNADRVGLWALPLISALFVTSLVSTSLTPRQKAVELVADAPHPRPSFPLLRVAVPTLETPGGGGQLPSTRSALVVRAADGQFAPVLAEMAPSMTNDLVRLLPDGGMRVRWRLRPNARFSDGAPVTVDDLLYSAALVKEPLRVALERVDERTVDLVFSERRADWLAGFTVFHHAKARLVPDAGREVLSRTAAEGKLPVAGPWKVDVWEPQKHLTLVRNDAFAGPRPTFERIEIERQDPLVAARALEAGQLDVIASLTPDAYEALKASPKVKVLEQPGELAWMLVPRIDLAPWNALDARRALLAAIDRRGLIAALAPSPARVASGWRAKPELKVPPAGKLEKSELTLAIAPIKSEDEPHALLARRLVADLARDGVTVKLVETPDLVQAVMRRDFEEFALISRDTGDPGRFMNVPSADGRLVLEHIDGTHYDEEMAERYEAWATSLYVERKDFLSAAMQEAWFERLPMIPLVITPRLAAIRSDLKGPEWGAADTLWWNALDWSLPTAAK